MKAGIALLILFFGVSAGAASLRPFVTDGCTNFPEGTPENRELWRDCCVQHDLYLWAGGTKDDRLKVDRNLRDCVLSKGAPVPAWVMFLGVRIGSHSPIRYKEKEWGNAWNMENFPSRPRFQALSRSEIEALGEQLENQPHPDLFEEDLRLFLSNLTARL